jgi:hypothetical protein
MAIFSGCGTTLPDNVTHVSGTVTFAGQPLALGMIVFEPDPAAGNRGPQGHADIKNGRFDTRQAGKAAAIGALIVRITGGDGVNPEPFSPFGKLLFEEHTTKVVLSKDRPTLELEVPQSEVAQD